jgi:hypothetical protein
VLESFKVIKFDHFGPGPLSVAFTELELGFESESEQFSCHGFAI